MLVDTLPSKKKLETHASLKVSRMKPVIKPSRPHKHAGYHELIFLFDGAGSHTIGDQRFEVVPPSGFYLGPDQIHCWDFSRIPSGFVLMFKESALASYMQSQQVLFNLPNQFKIKDQEILLALLEQFYEAYKQGASDGILYAFLNLILVQTQEFSEQPDHAASSFSEQFLNYKALVNEQFKETKNTEAYARQLNISIKQLQKICKTAVNASPTEVLKERMIIEAKNLLLYSNKNVSEIALELNFSDASNFIKFFKTHSNLTPLEFRGKKLV